MSDYKEFVVVDRFDSTCVRGRRVVLVPKADVIEKTDTIIKEVPGQDWKDARSWVNTRGIQHVPSYGWFLTRRSARI
jgi:hypothetical protein